MFKTVMGPIWAAFCGALSVSLTLIAVSAQAQSNGKVVNYNPPEDLPVGSIVVHTKQKALYLVEGNGTAIRYPVAVPKPGKEWSGYAKVDGKHENPSWSPPADVKAANSHLPDLIEGGSANNPMGKMAITLFRGKGAPDANDYAIHGTTAKMRSSIGKAASFGCIRMLNEDVVDLAQRIQLEALVLMTK